VGQQPRRLVLLQAHDQRHLPYALPAVDQPLAPLDLNLTELRRLLLSQGVVYARPLLCSGVVPPIF
jgi:hypothetical protein